VREQCVAEVAEHEEEGERERVVAVAELPQQQREPRRDHQRAEAVGGPSRPRREPGEQERETDRDRDGGTGVRDHEPVDLHLVREHGERDAGRDQGERQGSRCIELGSGTGVHRAIPSRGGRPVHVRIGGR